jgi:hypothetical protein
MWPKVRLLSAVAGTLLAIWPTLTAAQEGDRSAADAGALKSDTAPKGRPKVKLDALEFPDEIGGSDRYRRHLKHSLAREARRADWGAGHGSTIEYRFIVRELSVEHDGDVLRVKCVATGALPRGKTATSRLSFGGHPKARHELVQKVLDIVARGVVTRLAELERERRGR